MNNSNIESNRCVLVDDFTSSCWIDDDLTMSFSDSELLEIYYNTYHVISHNYHGRLMDILQIVYEELEP